MIVRYPNSVLVEPTQKVDFSVVSEIDRLSNDMFKELETAKGVGLAGNQFQQLTELGVSLSLFVVNFKEKENLFTRVFINPEMVGHSNETVTAPEMCLSFPGVSVNKERWAQITLRWLDTEAKEHQETFDGFKAVVIQHEMDHCLGKTIISSLPALKQKMLVDKMRKNLKKKNRTSVRVENLANALNDRVHPTSGKLIKSKSVRQRAKEMGITVNESAGQERLDFETARRMSNE